MATGNMNNSQSILSKGRRVSIEHKENEQLGCNHYKRNCKLISPCCKKKYVCRFCHDEVENHQLDRQKVEQIECLVCNTEQPVSNYCISEKCNVRFGKYFCDICKLFDNHEKGQYHCDGCGLCRAGGKNNFYHCNRCQMCLPKSLATNHMCIDEISHRDCPVCLEDIHTSRNASHMPPCGHLIHTPCFNELMKSGFYACPTCGTSMVAMSTVWQKLDEEIAKTPMDDEFANYVCNVLCKDCHKECSTSFHLLGLKCVLCGSYNTSRVGGALERQ